MSTEKPDEANLKSQIVGKENPVIDPDFSDLMKFIARLHKLAKKGIYHGPLYPKLITAGNILWERDDNKYFDEIPSIKYSRHINEIIKPA